MAARSRADVERLLLEGARAGNHIPRLGPEEAAPLSFAQERMWLLDRMLSNVTVYNVPRLLRVRGRVDEAALRSALDVVASRHAAIRTGISLVDDTLVQRVYDDRKIELEVHDLSDSREPPAEADRLVSELAWRRFDLELDTLVRAALIRMDDHDLLLLVSHHLVSDHGSGSILLDELSEAYDAACSGRAPVVPELPIQYADFAAWQRDRMSGPRLDEQTDHWCRRLAGIPDRLDLPFDKPRPPAKTYAGAEYRSTLPADLVDGLRALARTRNLSFFPVLLAGFYTLIYRYTGTEDIVVGTPTSGRHHAETEPLIGLFSNTLALRTTVEDELTFSELLDRVRATLLDGIAHQELPFERLVEALNPPRDPSHTPIYQVLFTHDHVSPSLELGGMVVETVSTSPSQPVSARTVASTSPWNTQRISSKRRRSSECSGTSRRCSRTRSPIPIERSELFTSSRTPSGVSCSTTGTAPSATTSRPVSTISSPHWLRGPPNGPPSRARGAPSATGNSTSRATGLRTISTSSASGTGCSSASASRGCRRSWSPSSAC
jgi:hypothetical protein